MHLKMIGSKVEPCFSKYNHVWGLRGLGRPFPEFLRSDIYCSHVLEEKEEKNLKLIFDHKNQIDHTVILLQSNFRNWISSVQSLSCVRLLVTPWIAAQWGLPVHHKLPEFTQTHVHWVGDAIQPSHPLSSLSAPVPNPSQHQGLFQWVNSSNEVAKVLEFQLQHQSFQWTPRTYLLQDGLVGSPCSPRDSQESSPTPQFKSINFLALSFSHSPTLTSIHDHCKNHSLD